MIDIYSRLGQTTPLKTKYSQIIPVEVSNILMSSEGEPVLIETDSSKEIFKKSSNIILRPNYTRRLRR